MGECVHFARPRSPGWLSIDARATVGRNDVIVKCSFFFFFSCPLLSIYLFILFLLSISLGVCLFMYIFFVSVFPPPCA